MYRYILIILLGLIGCTSQQLIPNTEPVVVEEVVVPEAEYTEERTLEDIQVTAPRSYTLPRYNAATPRTWDLIHMDLDVRFDWTNEHVIGREILFARPYFYPQQKLVLDAKGMDIMSITDALGKELLYAYDGKKINIDFARTITHDEEVEITIDYIAKPSEGPIGGSAAITSDKGLFFINPLRDDPNKPQQIWTQGETENNSRWFPTIDKPNERLTHTLSLTVEDRFKTLSNGTLVRSVNNGAGERTDYWEMNKPHAPYLVMLAVGDFAKVTEKWKDIDVSYYVEPEYEAYAKDIFAHTPEMIEFFSTLLDYPFPWSKYSQIITRDYVSGAMENTTAVIFGDFIQKTERELIDNDNDFIVAHELFHHWFGDLVTVESWANLTLQEGFANYSEYLWQEHKNGIDAADYQRHKEMQGYFASIMHSGIHPLIYYGYQDKEEMFDGHSYNKGGLVLHMLRRYLGDQAFFAALSKYLKDNAYTSVEVDELRMAFEDTCGEDLNWFFDQWYHEAGHPELVLEYDYDSIHNDVIVNVSQEQDPETSIPIFQLPVVISVYDQNGVETQYEVTLNAREQEIRLSYGERPALVVFDVDDRLLFIKKEKKTTEEYMRQYDWVRTYIHRFEAIDKIKNKKSAQGTLAEALNDNHFSIRRMAIDKIRLNGKPGLIAKVKNMITLDPHSVVRASALKKMMSVPDLDMSEMIQKVLGEEQAYNVIGAALKALNKIDPAAAVLAANDFKSSKSGQLTTVVAEILASTEDPKHLPFFEERLTSITLYSVFNFYDKYVQLLKTQPVDTQLQKAQALEAIATDASENSFYKFCATRAIHNLREALPQTEAIVADKMTEMIQTIKSKETNEMLLQRYSAY